MDILIDNRSGEPIYNQIYMQIKQQITSGALKEDSTLPSIRTLAKDLSISVITTKRAYEELEQEGFIYTVAGKGCFVASRNSDFIREEDLKKIEWHLAEIQRLASNCKLTKQDIIEMFNILDEEIEI